MAVKIHVDERFLLKSLFKDGCSYDIPQITVRLRGLILSQFPVKIEVVEQSSIYNKKSVDRLKSAEALFSLFPVSDKPMLYSVLRSRLHPLNQLYDIL